MINTQENSARNIKYACEALDISRRQLAAILNKSPYTINQYSSDNKLLSHDDIVSVLRYISACRAKNQEYANEILQEIAGNIPYKN